MRHLIILLLLPIGLIAQSNKDGFVLNYSALNIPDSLKKNAHIVNRLDQGILEVHAPGKYTYRVRQVMTILDKEGNHRLSISLGVNKFRKTDEVEIKMYNSLGLEVQKFKKKDFSTMAAYDGISLMTDDKVMHLQLPALQHPFTIDVSFVQEVSSFITLPNWFFVLPGESVEISRYTITAPKSMGIRYQLRNIKITPKVSETGEKISYAWEAGPFLACKKEEGAGGFLRIPMIAVASNQFEFDGHRGDLSAWKNLGLWYNDLARNVNKLSPSYQAEIRNLVNGISNERDKVARLYEHLQKNFRYVSIQLGIGGFKPFSADFVHEKKYGDCKALSNYMEACLDAVGLKGYSAWINAGTDRAPVDPEFPVDQFNHQILCVPLAKDTIWLECTSNKVDFGHLGNFTENRNALLLTENGGVLVPTPASKPHQNRFAAVTRVIMDEEGAGEIETRLNVSGEYKYELLYLEEEKADNQKTYFVNHLGFPNPDQFEVTFGAKSLQPLNTSMKMSLEKIHDFKAGSKMFLRPRIYKLWSSKLPPAENRTQDFVFHCPFEKIDTTIYVLPEGYAVEAMPKEKQATFELGSYTTKYWVGDDKKSIYATAKLVLNRHHVSASQYAKVKNFFDDVLMDDSQRIVIKR